MEYASATLAAAPTARRVWIQSPGWDLGWLIGSAAIVPLVLLVVWGGASSAVVNLGTTALIGGPHLFSTYTATYLDPRFRRSHRPMLWLITLAIPALVVWGTLANFQFLAVAPGNAGFAFTGASVKDPHARNLPAAFNTAPVQVAP